MTAQRKGQIYTALAFLVAGYLFMSSYYDRDTVRPKIALRDASTAESFLKFNILSHENMYLTESVPRFVGKGSAWSALVNDQMSRHLAGAPFVYKMPSMSTVFAYRLDFPTGMTKWVVWYDDGTTEPLIGPDMTVAIPVPDTPTGIIMTERMFQAGETEPLLRGYLVENSVVKITITRTPVFVYIKEE